jgi:hypothetical protein
MIAPKESPSDLTKILVERAIAAGRYLQSEQTKYVHAYYGEPLPGAHTIPLLENVLFSLALMRSHMVEQIQEAKILLKGILAFQNLNRDIAYGNFPVFLHEYPLCRDPSLGLQLLAPFFWILKQFGHVLGSQLRDQLEHASLLVLEYSLRFHLTDPFPYSLAVRLAAAQLSFGNLWQKVQWQQEGREKLERLAEQQLEKWQATTHLADLLVGLQMVYSSLKNTPWTPLWLRMEQTWHRDTASYIGPCIREWQEGEEPQPNVYDLYGGYFAGEFSRRATLLHPYHLQGALIQSSSDKFDVKDPSFIVEGKYKHQNWQTICLSEKAYTVLEKREPCPSSVDKTYTPFRLIWGDLHRVHSLVCQGGCYDKVEYILDKDLVHLNFNLCENSRDEEAAPKREIEFFVDFHPDMLFTSNGQSSTTFELGQPLTLSFGKYQLLIVFDLLEGEGNFLGHISRGNRPSQIHHKNLFRYSNGLNSSSFPTGGDANPWAILNQYGPGIGIATGGENNLEVRLLQYRDRFKFQAYDWTFFLRTIRRQGQCRIRATLLFKNNQDS